MTNGAWDFRVELVKLDSVSINAGERLGMVIVQPEYENVPDGTVSFQLSAECRQGQGDLIKKAFQIRSAEVAEHKVPIPFILFPEFAIPVRNPDGLDYLRQQMEQIQEDVIFIGGLEGLSKDDVRDVTDRFKPDVEIARPAFVDGDFVNVCVIAVKSAQGHLNWHFQAKLRPSQWEQPRNMARGQRVLYFINSKVAFLCQICFDHIAAQGQESIDTPLFRQLAECVQPNAATLDYVFVPQSNKNLDAMMKNTSHLLNHDARGIKNDMTSVVVINRSANIQESSDYGRSGFHWRKGRWQIRTADVGPKGYELYDLNGTTSAVFRKRTPAIHVMTLLPQSYNVHERGNPRQPLENPRSFLIAEHCDPTPCSCLPGARCAAGPFVACECLPCKLRDTLTTNLPGNDAHRRWQASDPAQSDRLMAHYADLRRQALALSPRRAGDLLDLLMLEYEHRKANPDTWEERRRSAVVELLAALSTLREWNQPLSLETEKEEWSALLGDFLAVVMVDGKDHECYSGDLETAYWRAFGGSYFKAEMRERAVLLVALRSEGQEESRVRLSKHNFLEPENRARLGSGPTYTESKHPDFWVCQGSLLAQARRERSINEFFQKEMEHIRG